MKSINIDTLKGMFISGAYNLYNYHFEVDQLNVFPVPDGDTGTNMNLTMMNSIKELNGKNYKTFKEMGQIISKGLIMGARGNSGVILSQIFRGFFKELENIETGINSQNWITAWNSAQIMAYKSVMRPVEGTILTVIRSASENISINYAKEENILKLMEKFYDAIKIALAKTTEQLPILAKVGVVDSGGAGLKYIIEGMLYYLKNNKIIEMKKNLIQKEKVKMALPLNQEDFGYCTETVIRLNNKHELELQIDKLRNQLEAFDSRSIVLVKDSELHLLKVHLHTLKPGKILDYLHKLGDLLNIKVENMTEQAESHVQSIKPIRKLINEYAIIAATNGRGIDNFFLNELKVQKTLNYSVKANPSTDDFLKAIEEVDAKTVYIIPNDSNLILTAQQAKKLEKKTKVNVIEAKNIAEGITAALYFNYEMSPKENFKEMTYRSKQVAYGYISIADKSLNLENVEVKKGDFIAAGINHRGGMRDRKMHIIDANKKIDLILKNLFKVLIKPEADIITIFKGKNVSSKQVECIKKILDEEYDLQYEIFDGKQDIYNFIFVVEYS